jgi:serine/threonine-protein kinase HipA
VLGEARLAPVYDVVTTTVYLPQDSMALTLNGTTRWPTAKILQRLGETRASCTPARVRQIFERIADAIADTKPELRAYIKEHPSFKEIGNGMLREWERGVEGSIAAAGTSARRSIGK